MTAFKAYLNSKKVQKVLSKRPGEEGFSLIELVVVIAVLAILAAVAIPAFNGIQNDARASAVKSGMANGIKECLVQQARGVTPLNFALSNAFEGDYNSYTLGRWNAVNTHIAVGGGTTTVDGPAANNCMSVRATATSAALPDLWMAIDADGKVWKACEAATSFTKANWTNQFCW